MLINNALGLQHLVQLGLGHGTLKWLKSGFQISVTTHLINSGMRVCICIRPASSFWSEIL